MDSEKPDFDESRTVLDGKSGPIRGKLNAKREKFARLYAETENATQSAIAAGYSPRSAAQQASDLLRVPVVRARVLELRKAMTERSTVDAAWVLEQLGQLARVDILQMFNDDGTLKPLKEMSREARLLIAGLEVEQSQTRGQVVKVKLIDRLRVLEMAGKHKAVAAWEQEQQVNVPVLVLRNYSGVPQPEEQDQGPVIDAE